MAQNQPLTHLYTNQETGYKESLLPDAFDSKKKIAFLAALKNNEFRLTATCDGMKISRRTLYKHLKCDTKFSEDFEKLREAYIDEVEQKLMEQAKEGGSRNITAQIFALKSWRPERYNPEHRVVVRSSNDEVSNLFDTAKDLNVIDATVVEQSKALLT